MRERPVECKDASYGPFAFFCSGRIIRSKGKDGTSGISAIRRAGRAMRARLQRLYLQRSLRGPSCLRSEPSTGPNAMNAAIVRPNSTPRLMRFDGWAQTTGRWGSAPSAPNAALIFSYAASAGASGTNSSLTPTGYVRRADDGSPFDDWYDRWLVRGGEAWCPDHWHVECDECHVHESGHADALEYHGWQIGERTICPECANNERKG